MRCCRLTCCRATRRLGFRRVFCEPRQTSVRAALVCIVLMLHSAHDFCVCVGSRPLCHWSRCVHTHYPPPPDRPACARVCPTVPMLAFAGGHRTFLCVQRSPRTPPHIPHPLNGTYDVLDMPLSLKVVRTCVGRVLTFRFEVPSMYVPPCPTTAAESRVPGVFQCMPAGLFPAAACPTAVTLLTFCSQATRPRWRNAHGP
jgi:hypothetical protein